MVCTMSTYGYSVVVVQADCVVKGRVRVVGGTHKVGAQATGIEVIIIDNVGMQI